MDPFLEQAERHLLQEICTVTGSSFQRQARLLLMSDSGLTARQIGTELGLSRSGVYYWVRRFRLRRMSIFDSFKKTDANSLSGKTVTEARANPESENLSTRGTAGKKDSLPFPDLRKSAGIQVEETLAETGRKILLFHFAQMIQHEPGTILGEDIEALHDMRVATRRMRAAMDLFADTFKPKVIKPFLKDLRQTGRALGKVRDLDVFIEKVHHYLQSLPETERQGLDSLLNTWFEQRNRQRISMMEYLESPAYKEFKRTFNLFLQTPGAGVRARSSHAPESHLVRQVAPVLLYTRLAAVNAYDDILPTATIPQLHSLRIELKRLRYALEFFGEVMGPQTKLVINEIKRLQDHLGDLNDADGACHLLADILSNWDNQYSSISLAERPAPNPVIAFLAYRAQERHRLLVSFPSAWENFTRPEIHQNFALAIAEM